jgi:hypothetical protein
MSARKDPLAGNEALSPNDEFADYGTWDKGSFGP